MMTKTSLFALTIAMASSSFAVTSPALAQTIAAEESDAPGDIVVTAQRRDTRLQDTPIAVSAFSEDTLAERQVARTQDLAASVPSLYINNISAGPSALTVMLRGAAEQVGGLATSESPVGIYLDDVYLARLSGANMELADVERIEVLRGPQGTLYGRNTMTGAIKIVTRRPTDQLWVRGSAGYGAFHQLRLSGAVAGPLSSGLGASASGYFTNRDGYFTNLGADPRRGDRQTYGGRLQLATLGDGPLSASLSLFYARDVNDGITPTPVSPTAPFASLTGSYNVTRSPIKAYGDNRQAGVIGNISYDLGSVTINSITGYIDTSDAWSLDFSGGFRNSTGAIVAGFYRQSASDQWQFSQELQAQGEGLDDRLNWILGAYYFKEKASQSLADSFGVGVFGPFPVALLPSEFNLSTESYALFGQASYEVAPALTVTAGLRYTHDSKTFDGRIQNGLATFPPVYASKSNDASWNALTPHFGVDYHFNDDVMAYATVSRGLRAGGFNGLAVANTTVFGAAFDPETVWAYEAGLKTQLLDRRVTANILYFRNELNDLQQTVQIGGASTRTENAADAVLQGVELELNARLSSSLTLFASGSLLYDDYTRLVPTSQAAINGATRLAMVSKFQSQIGFAWRQPIDDIAVLLVNGDWSHRSNRFNEASNQPLGLMRPFDRINAGIGFETLDATWQLMFTARNLTNSEDYYTSLGLIPGLIAVRFHEEPRSYMITLRYRLGD
jgi:iron complex outermembrane receptor protein